MKRIVIVANFCNNFANSRFCYLADLLGKNSEYQVELITSDFSHRTKEYKKFNDFISENYYIKYCHEPGYISHKGIKRLLSHRAWGKAVVRYIAKGPKPDIIYCAIPSLTAAHDLAIYCRKHDIKFVVDVQDLWPEATFMLIKNRLIQKCSSPMARYIDVAYGQADAIVAVSETYAERAHRVNTKDAPQLCVYLGNDAERFNAAKSNSGHNEIFTIAYIGTIGYSYDLGCVINALKIIKDQKAECRIKFLVMGDGPLREKFERMAVDVGVECEFTGMLPYNEMVRCMCACDVLVNPIVKGAAQSITNKVGDYALAGLPVVNSQECEEYRKLIDDYGCGINCQVGNPEEMAQAIITLYDNPELRKRMGEQSLQLGNERFDRRSSYKKIVALLDSILL